MRYHNVFIESLGYTLPSEVVTTDALEHQLAPVYERLRLPHGRLELMTGIVERRFFPPGITPGQVSILSGRQALEESGIRPSEIGALVHGSVCRDHLEPATACRVHHGLQLPSECMIYDISNACLGILTGIVQIANMIELGQIRAGLVVGTECGRELVENTVRRLNQDLQLTRRDIKRFVASLTIGSGSVAVVLCDEKLSRTRNRLVGGSVQAHSDHHALCQSEGLQTFMETDSEQLMLQGVAVGAETFGAFLHEVGWSRREVDKTAGHQVGVAHRKLLLEALDLDPRIDYTTLEKLGNTGSVALPLTLALGAEEGHVEPGDSLALLGIGSGINCQMLAVAWHETRVAGSCYNSDTNQYVSKSKAIAPAAIPAIPQRERPSLGGT
jgi:acyl-CoA:acyl-CoA alkyltransferase